MVEFDQYHSEFERARPDYEKLSKETQIIGALIKLELDMYNGGFVQFFCNWGYTAYCLAISGLEQMGALETAGLLLKEFSIIDKYKDDGRIRALWDIPKVLSKEDDAKLDELDKRYWEDKDKIMEKMLTCYPKD